MHGFVQFWLSLVAILRRLLLFLVLLVSCEDAHGKATDSRFPGWTFQSDFRYETVTQCECVAGNWQTQLVVQKTPLAPTPYQCAVFPSDGDKFQSSLSDDPAVTHLSTGAGEPYVGNTPQPDKVWL